MSSRVRKAEILSGRLNFSHTKVWFDLKTKHSPNSFWRWTGTNDINELEVDEAITEDSDKEKETADL